MPEDSKTAPLTLGTGVWELPPLILHPFSNQRAPGVLLEGSKAALMLAGLLPGQGEDHDELKESCSSAVMPKSACSISWARICCVGSGSAWIWWPAPRS